MATSPQFGSPSGLKSSSALHVQFVSSGPPLEYMGDLLNATSTQIVRTQALPVSAKLSYSGHNAVPSSRFEDPVAPYG